MLIYACPFASSAPREPYPLSEPLARGDAVSVVTGRGTLSLLRLGEAGPRKAAGQTVVS